MSKLLTFAISAFTLTTHAAPCLVSNAGLEIVQHYEGFAGSSYRDHGNDRWTIGYGHQDSATEGQRWSKKRAKATLKAELQALATKLCQLSSKPLTNNQATALASLAYNIGTARFLKSELWASIQAGKPSPTLFMQYRRMRGKITAGLVRRRIAESVLFVTPDNSTLNVPEIVDAIEKYQPTT